MQHCVVPCPGSHVSARCWITARSRRDASLWCLHDGETAQRIIGHENVPAAGIHIVMLFPRCRTHAAYNARCRGPPVRKCCAFECQAHKSTHFRPASLCNRLVPSHRSRTRRQWRRLMAMRERLQYSAALTLWYLWDRNSYTDRSVLGSQIHPGVASTHRFH